MELILAHDALFNTMSPICMVCNDSGERWVWCGENGKDTVACECVGGL